MTDKQPFAKFLLAGVLAGMPLFTGSAFADNFAHTTWPGAGSSKNEKRVIHCPKEISLGSLTVKTDVDAAAQLHSVPARGEVTLEVPAHAMVVLDVSPAVQTHPEALAKLKNEPIDVLSVKHFRSLDDGDSTSNRILNSVKGMNKLRAFQADDTDTTDEGLANLKGWHDLQALKLFLTTTKGKFLDDIHGAPNLIWLRLWFANLDQQYLRNLASFPKLRWLMVRACHLNETGIKYIAQCAKLEELAMEDNAIDDKMLTHVAALKNLQRLSIANTSVSLHGLESLKKLPIKVLVLPAQIGAENDKALAKLFPGAIFMHPARRKATSDEKMIFAPTQK